MTYSFERVIDELTKEQWSFYFSGNIYLDSYSLLERENKSKRKYEVIKHYERLNHRSSSKKIEESEVPFTDEIKKMALDFFIKNIEVKKWSERKF